MPRKPLFLKCRICGKPYPAKDRKYKRTCSPNCALISTLTVAYSNARNEGLLWVELYDAHNKAIIRCNRP